MSLATERLVLRRLTLEAGDLRFIVELLNEPSFLRHIGDKQVRDSDGARRYLENGPLASYARFGFGLYAVERRHERDLIGMCGLVRRDTLPLPDLGFAFLPRVWSQGYAGEAARAVLGEARALGLARLLAITTPENGPSLALLRRLGFGSSGRTRLSGSREELELFELDLCAPAAPGERPGAGAGPAPPPPGPPQ